MLDTNEQSIINFLKVNQGVSSKEIHEAISSSVSYATVKRILAKLVLQNFIATQGQRKATKYYVSKAYEILSSVDLDKYYSFEIDERKIKKQFSFDLIRVILSEIDLFTKEEITKLNALQNQFENNEIGRASCRERVLMPV